jgi:hypothetical protein
MPSKFTVLQQSIRPGVSAPGVSAQYPAAYDAQQRHAADFLLLETKCKVKSII